jgi:methyl-accepting chemotaxis protein
MRMKLVFSLSAIAVTLLISSIISVMEFTRMNNYVSDLFAGNIKSINAARKLSEVANAYNLDILAVVGDESTSAVPDFNQEEFLSRCDSLKSALKSTNSMPLADSVVYSYQAYMLTSLELENVLISDFINSRAWYFERLQPKYNRLSRDIDNLSTAVYNDLGRNSATFDRGFYRSIIPGIVAVAVGLLLIVMLLVFLLSYYVNPVYKMLRGLDDYRASDRKYTYEFDGDDQLVELNRGLKELTGENRQLRKRVSDLRDRIAEREGKDEF